MWDLLKVKKADPEKCSWIRIAGREKVEPLLVEWCAKHFHQAAETPLAKGECERRLNILDPNNRIEEILKGEYESPDIDIVECVEWIHGMRKKDGITSTELEVTLESFKKFIKETKESKTPSPSGRHYGHYRAILNDESLCNLVFSIVEITVMNGVVLDRWKTVHQILLLKDHPRARIDRLRNITIVEADLMYVMKYVWARRLARNIKESGRLNKSQYARSGQIAQMSVYNKRLSYDLQLILREEAFQADNDVMNCYDCILDIVAVIVLMRIGLMQSRGGFLRNR